MNNNHLFPTLTLHFIFFLIVLPLSHCDNDEDRFSECSRPYYYKCGSTELNISYPFWGAGRPQYCGREGFQIGCQNDDYHFIELEDRKFRVLSINDSHPTMIIARDDLWNNLCPGVVSQQTFDNHPSRFKYNLSIVRQLRFSHNCSETISSEHPNYLRCMLDARKISFYTLDLPELHLSNLTSICQTEIIVPVLLTALHGLTGPETLMEVVNKGFEVDYDANNESCSHCKSSGGTCGSDHSSPEQFLCFCPGYNPQKIYCPAGRKPNKKKKAIIGIFSGLTLIIITCIFKWKKKSVMSWKETKNDRDLEAFIRTHGSLAPKRYSFLNVKIMTDSFKNKLGQGGYGEVYKGMLQDGQLVAVKLLNTSKGNGQEFINEVASISRTSHVNIVALLGFCLEGDRRALIYEFMSNGSLEKLIHCNYTLKTNRHLGWENLYRIALGIARGLDYLHSGCSTRIFHFDIKPHNILLDEDFCPKIADFGLAKLCPKKESVVSMLEARGTIGYIAPEIFNRNFGDISHKADVYSYGIMILEMVGGRKNLHLGVENSSEIYFPNWIYKHLELDKEINLQDIKTSDENEIAKKMIIVGLWCIQMVPLDRPSINKVIEMLQGGIEALQIPSNPFQYPSSPRPTLIDSTTISISG